MVTESVIRDVGVVVNRHWTDANTTTARAAKVTDGDHEGGWWLLSGRRVWDPRRWCPPQHRRDCRAGVR